VLDTVRDKNLRPRAGKPLSDYPLPERYRHMNEAADEIAKIAREIASQNRTDQAAQDSSPKRLAQMAGESTIIPSSSPQPSEIRDRSSLRNWLAGQKQSVIIALAVRAALRVVPITVPERHQIAIGHTSVFLASAFRATAVARTELTGSIAFEELRSARTSMAGSTASAAKAATESAAWCVEAALRDLQGNPINEAAASAIESSVAAATFEAATLNAAEPIGSGRDSDLLGDVAGADSSVTMWSEVKADAEAAQSSGFGILVDLPLWTFGGPHWANRSWHELKSALPRKEDWWVWIDWYQMRLRGGSLGEAYERVFALAPQREWDKSPAAANAWIRANLPTSSVIQDRMSLELWLNDQPREVAAVLVSRALLRSWLYSFNRSTPHLPSTLTALFGAFLRITAFIRMVAISPLRADGLPDARLWVERIFASLQEVKEAQLLMASVEAAKDSLEAMSARSQETLARNGASAIASAVDTSRFSSATTFVSSEASRWVADEWSDLRIEASTISARSVDAVAKASLWRESHREAWALRTLDQLAAALPRDQGWDVWIDWYKECLRSVSRGEAYDLVFASVPQEEWDRGPAAANAWIKAHLPKPSEAAQAAELPQPSRKRRIAVDLRLDG
jgi:hypothetical protein